MWSSFAEHPDTTEFTGFVISSLYSTHKNPSAHWLDSAVSRSCSLSRETSEAFPSPSAIQIHPNFFWVDLVLRRVVFVPQYHKLKVQNLFTPKEKASPLRKHHLAETHQVMGPHSMLKRWSLPATKVSKAVTGYFLSSLKKTRRKTKNSLMEHSRSILALRLL